MDRAKLIENATFNLVIRERDGKCRAERNGKPITGWCRNAMKALNAVRRKECVKT